MIYQMQILLIGYFLSFCAFAGSNFKMVSADPDNLGNHYSIVANLGYGEYQHVYSADNQTVIGRLALAAELLTTNQAAFGLEIGIQSGNKMRITIPQSTLETLSCAVKTTMRPMFDLLVTAQANPLDESLLFTQVKGGIAYRHWQINSVFVNNKNDLAGEIQAGLGYPLTEIANLSVLYQGVFGGNPKLRLKMPLDMAYMTNAPIQHGILLGFSIIA